MESKWFDDKPGSEDMIQAAHLRKKFGSKDAKAEVIEMNKARFESRKKSGFYGRKAKLLTGEEK